MMPVDVFNGAECRALDDEKRRAAVARAVDAVETLFPISLALLAGCLLAGVADLFF